MKPMLLAVCLLAACSSTQRLTYSSGFSFANYDNVVFARSATGGDLFGLDVEFGNLLAQFGMRVVGDKEFETLEPEARARTLFARVAFSASSDRQLLSITFDDSTTGKTVATVTQEAEGDMLDPDDRAETLDAISQVILEALQRDKGLLVR